MPREKTRSSFSACFDPFDQAELLSAARRRIKEPRRLCERLIVAAFAYARRALNPSASSSPPELAVQPAAQRGGGFRHNLPSFVTICCSLHTQRRSPVTPRSRHQSPPHQCQDLCLCRELFC